MKFYLTKAAQREAEGQSKPEKKSISPVETKARRSKSAAPAAAGTSAAMLPTSTPAPAGPPSQVSSVASAPVATVAPALVAAQLASEPAAGVEKAAKDGRASKSAKTDKAARPAKQAKNVIAIGGQPRVDLLPQEVRNERRGAHNVRRAWAGVAAVAVLAVIATGAATLYSSQAASTLSATQGQTSTLVAQQGKYSKVKAIQSAVQVLQAGQSVGGSTEIDWNTYLAKVQATLPYTVTITAVDLTSSSPLTAYAQSTSPLLGTRVATLTFTATSTALPSLPTWLDGLRSLPGYADATAGSVSYNATDKTYTANVTMHINQRAYSGRFAEKGK